MRVLLLVSIVLIPVLPGCGKKIAREHLDPRNASKITIYMDGLGPEEFLVPEGDFKSILVPLSKAREVHVDVKWDNFAYIIVTTRGKDRIRFSLYDVPRGLTLSVRVNDERKGYYHTADKDSIITAIREAHREFEKSN